MTRLRFKRGFQRQFIETGKVNLECNTFHDLADKISVNYSTLKNWLIEDKTLPKDIFERICLLDSRLRRFTEYITEELEDNWGYSVGGKRSSEKLPDHHFIRMRNEKDSKREGLKFKFVPPESKFVEDLRHQKINLLPILAAGIMTDGTIDRNANRIEYTTKDPVLRDISINMMHELSRYTPLSFRDKSGIFRIRIHDRSLIERLFDLSPSFKTSPNRNQSAIQFLDEIQPSIMFLENYDIHTLNNALKFAFSADGSVYDFGIMLSCSHYRLCVEWANVMRKAGIETNICKNRGSWSGFSGIRTSSYSNILKFRENIGFIEGVKTTMKSRYFSTKDKNEVLNTLLKKYHRRSRGSAW